MTPSQKTHVLHSSRIARLTPRGHSQPRATHGDAQPRAMLSFVMVAASAADPTATGPLVPFVAYPHNAAHDDAAIDTAPAQQVPQPRQGTIAIAAATDAAKLRRRRRPLLARRAAGVDGAARFVDLLVAHHRGRCARRACRREHVCAVLRARARRRRPRGARLAAHLGRSSFHASPLAHDIDGDGVDELLFVSFDAEVVVLRPSGLPLAGASFKLPKLKVKKRWHEQLRDVHTTPYCRASQRRTWHDDEPVAEVEAAAAAAASAAAQAAEFGGDVARTARCRRRRRRALRLRRRGRRAVRRRGGGGGPAEAGRRWRNLAGGVGSTLRVDGGAAGG